MQRFDLRLVFVACACVCTVWAAGAASTSAGGGDPRAPLRVQVDRGANLYLDGVRIDTLLVCRGQWIHWAKLDPSDPDLSILFDRKLLHPRHPVRIRISSVGKPARYRIAVHARLRAYVGTPEGVLIPGSAAHRLIHVLVVPPSKQ